MAGPFRPASRKVNAYLEIGYGLSLGLLGGFIWRAWHMSYKATVEDFYKKYDAKLAENSTK